MKPKLQFGKSCAMVATKSAVLYIEQAVVVSRMVMRSLVMSLERVENGLELPSSSTNCCTFHGDIFVIADSALCITADKVNNKNHASKF